MREFEAKQQVESKQDKKEEIPEDKEDKNEML